MDEWKQLAKLVLLEGRGVTFEAWKRRMDSYVEKTRILRNKESPNTKYIQPIAVEVSHGGDAGEAPGGAVGDKAGAKDPKKNCCWNCQTPDHAAELRKCSGCIKVR